MDWALKNQVFYSCFKSGWGAAIADVISLVMLASQQTITLTNPQNPNHENEVCGLVDESQEHILTCKDIIKWYKLNT